LKARSNPFNERAIINVQLPEGEYAELIITDIYCKGLLFIESRNLKQFSGR
jgi:hypothetical protein